jgi:hypothetical protein
MAKELIKADTAIRTAKPEEAAYRIMDGAGLYLLVKPDGAKWWRAGPTSLMAASIPGGGHEHHSSERYPVSIANPAQRLSKS